MACIRKPFYAEEGHSILTETSFLHKFFSQWQQVFNFFLKIYNLKLKKKKNIQELIP